MLVKSSFHPNANMHEREAYKSHEESEPSSPGGITDDMVLSYVRNVRRMRGRGSVSPQVSNVYLVQTWSVEAFARIGAGFQSDRLTQISLRETLVVLWMRYALYRGRARKSTVEVPFDLPLVLNGRMESALHKAKKGSYSSTPP